MRSKYLSDYVYLAEASYADFTGISINNGNNSDKDAIKRKIINTKEPNSKPESFAKLVTDHYTVEAHWEDRGNDSDAELSESGFSGTLFKSTEGKYVLALRGTAGNQDLIETDVGDIVLDGFALKQSIDLMNFR